MGYRELMSQCITSQGLFSILSSLYSRYFRFLCHAEGLHTCCFSIGNVYQGCLHFPNYSTWWFSYSSHFNWETIRSLIRSDLSDAPFYIPVITLCIPITHVVSVVLIFPNVSIKEKPMFLFWEHPLFTLFSWTNSDAGSERTIRNQEFCILSLLLWQNI